MWMEWAKFQMKLRKEVEQLRWRLKLNFKVDAYVHQMVLWSRDRLRPQLTGWYSRRPWRSIAKGHGPIPSQLFVKVSLP
ncbi:UNVERIFIED_CONTAM: hypothetical protein FKN15_029533 [Acipenser sinensis]